MANNIVFACISPHPPIILPNVGSERERKKVIRTIRSLEKLGEEFKNNNPGEIIISSPHQDWGFNVPLYFLAENFQGKIKPYLIGIDNPKAYFELGKVVFEKEIKNNPERIALIASGDLSHRLKEEGPYGFHSDGPKFDKELIENLKKKNLERIFQLDDLYPEAGECGLRSFCFILGILEAAKINWHAKILSYEAPFGVGYLVAKLV